jgi:[protein-PII] uridylyltransferase
VGWLDRPHPAQLLDVNGNVNEGPGSFTFTFTTPAPTPSPFRAALDAASGELAEHAVAGGDPCAALTQIYDRELAARFAHAAGPGAKLALVATGGWARRELAPYSDLDFIVLHDRDEAAAKAVADKLLYPLWDDKVAVGHQIREPRAAAKLAKGDLATATALLDARHVAGERRLTSELVRATLGAVAPGGNPSDLIAVLADEQRGRHDRFGATLYLLEPNLKQGIGALRDLATALWAAQARWAPPQPDRDPPGAPELVATLVALGHLTRRQGDVLVRAREFLLRLRALVQLAGRRRFDQLTFEIQEAIAPRLYPDARAADSDADDAAGGRGARPAVAPAVEALMRDYYLHARGVVQVAERLLDGTRGPARRRPRIDTVDISFVVTNGELEVRDPRLFVDRPSEMIRLFRVSVADAMPVHGHTRELVAEALAHDPQPLARDPAAPRLLLDALVDVRDGAGAHPAQPSAFERMHQVGILSALMPEWAPCTARVQHDLYHVYTVDQHQLYTLALQKRLARGELAAEHPTAHALWREVARPAPLLLATLLHDVGKPLGKGHAEKGAVITHAIARRLGMSESDAALAELLVRQHLTMSHLSQRRDLADPDVVERFAERIGDDERLVSLYLLTLCDTAMTAPNNLSAWKDELLRDLVLRTRARFRRATRGAPDGDAADTHVTDARDRVAQLVAGDAAAAAMVDAFDPRLVTQLTPRQAARHAKLLASVAGTAPPVALEVHCYPMKGHSELAIVAPDAPGVLAAIAGALTAHRVDVLGAVLGRVSIGPGPGSLVADVFFVRDLKGAAIPDDDARWPRLLDDLRALLDAPDPERVAQLIARRRPPSGLPARVTPGVRTEIRLHDDSTRATIVEVTTRDRVGVLHAITHVLAELGLDIELAKVSTEGEKVADVFYVTRGGDKLVDAAARADVVARLERALA